ncbi:MAG: hypothetical protein Q4P26_07595 [Lachnospiraceae bacterium]|nr:hypothetical protein [Lachnospiraceae bacterium]
MREKQTGNAKRRRAKCLKAAKSGTVWKPEAVRNTGKKSAHGFWGSRTKAEVIGKTPGSVLSGLAVEIYLDHCFGFPRGAEWFPALVMLGICLSILAAVLLEGLRSSFGKAERTIQAYKIEREADAISSYVPLENSCSFSKNACILSGGCRKTSVPPARSEKARRNLIVFSRAKVGRGLRNVC